MSLNNTRSEASTSSNASGASKKVKSKMYPPSNCTYSAPFYACAVPNEMSSSVDTTREDGSVDSKRPKSLNHDSESSGPHIRSVVTDLWISFSHFSRETTLHGVKRITLASALWKKCLWVLLMLLMFIALIYQLTNKLRSYFGTPVALDMEVQYLTTMTFPAVMLCNANLFRISEATKPKWNMSMLLRTLYNETASVDVNYKRFPQLKRIDGAKFLKASAHQKENMILHCSWPDGQDCTSDDFLTVITDYGVCYAINDRDRNVRNSSDTNVTGPFVAGSTGSGYGLYLLLNVEDYEAMAGPQKTVGVKVLIYEQGSTPAVSEQGFDVAPGFQISVGLKKKMTKRLKKDAGGQCDEAPLRLFKGNHSYSRRLCALDQKYWTASNACSCLPYSYNMFEKNYLWPVCNASQYFTCMVKAMQRAPDISEEDCPQDCNITEYQQYVSFSKLSPINIDALLTEKQRRDMQRNYLRAREARSRSDASEVSLDQRLIERLLNVYEEFENRSFVPGGSVYDSLMTRMGNISCFAEYLKPLMVRSGFCSEDALDSIVMKPLAKLLPSGVVEHGHLLVKQLNQSQTVCRSLAEDIAFHFFTKFLNSFTSTSTPAEAPSADEIAAIVQQQLLVETSKTAVKQLSMNLDAAIREFTTATSFVDSYMAYTENITALNEFNQTHLLREFLANTTVCLTNLTQFVPAPSELTYLDMKKTRIKKKLLNCTEAARECMRLAGNFTELFRNYQELVISYKTNHTVIVDEIRATCRKLDGIRQMEDKAPPIRKQGVTEYEELREHMQAFNERRQTKAEFTKEFLELANKLHFFETVKHYFDDVRDYVKDLQKGFYEAGTAVGALIRFYDSPVYTDILDLAFADSAYKSTDNSALSRLLSANACLPQMDDLTNTVLTMVDQSAHSFMQHLHPLREHLQKYNTSLRLDEYFYQNNLLALNIYLRDKSVETLKQKKTSDFWSLVSDIGGTLGLFLGASLLTVGEIIEYVCCQCAHVFRTRQTRSHSKKHQAENGTCTNGQGRNRRRQITRSEAGTGTEMNLLLRSGTTDTNGMYVTQSNGAWPGQNRNASHNPAVVNGNATATFALVARRQPVVIVTERPWSRRSITIDI